MELLTEHFRISIYFIDHVLHIFSILIISSLINGYHNYSNYFIFFGYIITYPQFLLGFSWIATFLFITMPASVTIRRLLDKFKPCADGTEGIQNAGSLIDIFERLIMVLFLYAGQYFDIGFAITAKSIARYKRITEDSQFSEYYLLGTLLSVILALLSYMLLLSRGFEFEMISYLCFWI